MIDLQGLKTDDFDAASRAALSIRTELDETIGALVPVGAWALRDESLLADFADWRRIFMRFFLSQFDASIESTRNYLEKLSLGRNDRIFFAVYLEDRRLVGHIGLSNVSAEKAELDNIIRGRAGGHPDLMYYAEKTLLSWAFDRLRVKRVEAQVISKNFMAASLHERFGFTLRKSLPLRKETDGESLRYVPCAEGEATERFTLNIIEVTRQGFVEATRHRGSGVDGGERKGSVDR